MSEIKNKFETNEQQFETGLKNINKSLERSIGKLSASETAEKVSRIKAEIVRELNKGARETSGERGDVSFAGSYDMHMADVKRHQDKYMVLERKANNLERDIRRKLEPGSKMAEVRSLRKEAKTEQQQMERSKELAGKSLKSFRGSEAEHEFKQETDDKRANTPSFGRGHCQKLCQQTKTEVIISG